MKKIGMLLLLFFCSVIIFSQTRGIKFLVDKLDKNYKVGNQYLFIIGIDNYTSWPALKNPVKDAKEIQDVIKKQYYIDEVFELYNEQATKANIIKRFRDIQNKLEIHDSLLIFYAGHGHYDKSTNTGFWIPVNAGTDVDAQLNWLPNSQIRGVISNIKAIHVLLISDSCFSGDILNSVRALPSTIDNEYFKKAYGLVTRQVLTSGASETVPDESSFARQLKLSLQKNTNPYLDPYMLYNEIRLGVKSTTPLFGNLKGTGHQDGGSFILFSRQSDTAATEAIKTSPLVEDETTPKNKEEKKLPSLPVINELFKLQAPIKKDFQHFGSAIAISKEFVIISASIENEGDIYRESGAAYLFKQTDENRFRAGIKITPGSSLEARRFGSSVSITEENIIIGAQGDNGTSYESERSGAAYIYTLAGENFEQNAKKILPPDAQEDDNFGWSVSITNEFALVGAPEEDGGNDDPLLEAGAAYVYMRKERDDWEYGNKLIASDADENDQFGWAVAISGEHAFVSAPFEDGGKDNLKPNAGAVYLYSYSRKGWSEQKFTAPDAQAGDQFGFSIATNGVYTVIGSPEKDSGKGDTLSNTGAVYIYRCVGKNNWDDVTKISSPDLLPEGCFGKVVAISNAYILVGSLEHTYLFLKTGSNKWEAVARLKASGTQEYEMFGDSLVVNDRYAMISARGMSEQMENVFRQVGYVYIFDVQMDTIHQYLEEKNMGTL